MINYVSFLNRAGQQSSPQLLRLTNNVLQKKSQ